MSSFVAEFIMARGRFDPKDFGVNMEREAFMDLMVEEFQTRFRDNLTIDELLLHPREALMFCDAVRLKHGFYFLPDDIVLRSVMTRRKSP